MKTATIVTLCITVFGLLGCSHSKSNDTASWLRDNDIESLQTYFDDLQRRFTDGAATEFELRDNYRPFYQLDDLAVRHLRDWAESSAESYPAHLAFGIYLKKRAIAARGGDYIAKTPRARLDEAQKYFVQSAVELQKSLPLTAKPYLSLFHLLDIEMYVGDRVTAETSLRAAQELFPANMLVRDRYQQSLMPRWGGSYQEAEAFILKTKEAGGSQNLISQLQAIEYDDKGHALEESGDHAGAHAAFEHALSLGKTVGGTFSKDFLDVSRYYICSNNRSTYCE